MSSAESGHRLAHPRAELGQHVAATLRVGGVLRDSTFDELFPIPIRGMSRVFWTPVAVARRAAELLVNGPRCRVLDVGSGAGKFCVVAGLSTPSQIFGVEQDETLVACACDVAAIVGAKNVSFLHCPFHLLNPQEYDAFYFFNPFEENNFWSPSPSDSAAPDRFAQDVRNAQQFLRAARLGARVVTYNGMGGRMPSGYKLAERDGAECGLELWVKVA